MPGVRPTARRLVSRVRGLRTHNRSCPDRPATGGGGDSAARTGLRNQARAGTLPVAHILCCPGDLFLAGAGLHRTLGTGEGSVGDGGSANPGRHLGFFRCALAAHSLPVAVGGGLDAAARHHFSLVPGAKKSTAVSLPICRKGGGPDYTFLVLCPRRLLPVECNFLRPARSGAEVTKRSLRRPRPNAVHLMGSGHQFAIYSWATPSPGPPRLKKTPVAVHPLPQGGEGNKFKLLPPSVAAATEGPGVRGSNWEQSALVNSIGPRRRPRLRPTPGRCRPRR